MTALHVIRGGGEGGLPLVDPYGNPLTYRLPLVDMRRHGSPRPISGETWIHDLWSTMWVWSDNLRRWRGRA